MFNNLSPHLAKYWMWTTSSCVSVLLRHSHTDSWTYCLSGLWVAESGTSSRELQNWQHSLCGHLQEVFADSWLKFFSFECVCVHVCVHMFVCTYTLICTCVWGQRPMLVSCQLFSTLCLTQSLSQGPECHHFLELWGSACPLTPRARVTHVHHHASLDTGARGPDSGPQPHGPHSLYQLSHCPAPKSSCLSLAVFTLRLLLLRNLLP